MTADPNDAANYDDCGFDIYHDDAPLDFATLGTTGGRKFCILKVSEGTTVKDTLFGPRIAQLIPTNIKRLGAYHYAHHTDPVGQMQFFLETFKTATQNIPNKPGFLFMLDLEVNVGEPDPPQEADGLTMVQQLQSVGINPIIYCGRDFWSASHPELAACPHLLAAYDSNPVSALPWRVPGPNTYGWDIWQYTDGETDPAKGGPYTKTVPGGSQPMDLDCFNLQKHPQGLEAWWDAQLAGTRQP
jgi:GH25 family lysozyme M1 (1,4-beta-N-acetylmuramidase)